MAVAEEGRAAGVGAGPAGAARGGRPEIVFGLVGALGTDLASALFGVGYTAEPVRVSDLIVDADIRAPGSRRAPVTQLDERMDQGDALREALSDGGAAAGLAVMRISAHRHERLEGAGEDGPVPELHAHASVVRSLKHPEEVRLLRSVYGPRFVLIGAWAPRDEREREVGGRLRREHSGKPDSWYAENVSRLLLRDEKDQPLGQRVRDTFELADAYVALLPGRDIGPQMQRLIRLLFASPFETPTWEEQAMHQAAGARLRSADAGRQVGAVVVDGRGELLLTGTNEVPRAGGAQYWSVDVPDHRDFRYGYDGNERQKLALVVTSCACCRSRPAGSTPRGRGSRLRNSRKRLSRGRSRRAGSGTCSSSGG